MAIFILVPATLNPLAFAQGPDQTTIVVDEG
jgi:hypothetical protein